MPSTPSFHLAVFLPSSCLAGEEVRSSDWPVQQAEPTGNAMLLGGCGQSVREPGMGEGWLSFSMPDSNSHGFKWSLTNEPLFCQGFYTTKPGEPLMDSH